MKPLTTESDHFVINYFIEDSPIISEILEKLESNYNRITFLLQVELPEKSVLYIYPSIAKFHEAIGRAGAPDWVAGNFDQETKAIKIVSPYNPGTAHDYDSIMAIVIHEFVHLAAAQINSQAPDYIAEGVATYFAGQDDCVKETIQTDIKAGDFPTMAQLRCMTDEIYQYGYAFIEYVISKYGIEGVLKLYKTADIKKALGAADDEFHESWKAYLIEMYSIDGMSKSI